MDETDRFCGGCGAALPSIPPPVAPKPPQARPPVAPGAAGFRNRKDWKPFYIVAACVAAYLVFMALISLVKARDDQAAVDRIKADEAITDKKMAEFFRETPQEKADRKKPLIPWDGKGLDPNFPLPPTSRR